jgi:hypothetical protein
MKRTNLQRHWIKRGYPREMCPMRPQHGGSQRYTYLMRASEDWRSQREFARDVLGMPIRPVAKQMIHDGRKP